MVKVPFPIKPGRVAGCQVLFRETRKKGRDWGERRELKRGAGQSGWEARKNASHVKAGSEETRGSLISCVPKGGR